MYDNTLDQAFTSSCSFKRLLNAGREGLPAEVKRFDKKSAQVFSSLLKEESYPHFESRLMLAGEQGTGKTTLARYLVGKQPTRFRISTDGIELYNGLSYMDRESKDWLGGLQDFSLEDITVSRSLLKEDKIRKPYEVDDTLSTKQDIPFEPQTMVLPGSKRNPRHNSNNTLTSDITPEGSEHIDFHLQEITSNTSNLQEDLTHTDVKLEAATTKSQDLLAIAQTKSLPTSEDNLRQETSETLTPDATQEGSQLENIKTLSDHRLTTLSVDVGSIAEPMSKQLSDDGSEKQIKTQYNDDEYETAIHYNLPISEEQLGVLITNRKSSNGSKNRDEQIQQDVLSGNENVKSPIKKDIDEFFLDNSTPIDDSYGSRTKSVFSDKMQIETVTKPGVIRKLKNIFGIYKKVKEVKVSITKEKFFKKSSKVGQKQLHNKQIAPIIIWDFGGQDVFYSTHQTFLTYRAIYMVVLDGSRKLDDPCPNEQYLPGKGQHKTARDYLLFWINTIVTYCKGSNQGFPKIMVVLTHKDQVKANEIENRRHEIFGEINKMFQQTPLAQHLVIEEKIFVNAKDKHDTEMEKIKEVIICESERQPTWVRICIADQTQHSVDHPRTSKENKQPLQPIRPLSEDELKVFLKFQHSIGKLLYFDELKLDDRIVLSPTLLIDAFKSIVTDRRFCKGDRNREEIWDAMGMKGVVFKQAIHEVWKRKKYAKFNKEKDYLLAVMTHLDILVEPKRYDSSRTRIPADFYYVASMVRAIDDSGYLQSAGITKRNIALAFQSSSLMIPPALSFRFISYCLSVWSVKTYGETNRDMLFHRSGVFTIDPSLDMYVLCEDDKITVRLVHARTNALIIKDLASSISECITSALEKISQLYIKTSSDQSPSSDASFVTSICCHSPDKPCILPFENLKHVEKIWKCPTHGIEHNIHMIKSWIPGKEEDRCELGCPVTNEEFLKELPTDLHLRRLSVMYSSNDIRDLTIHLGLSATDVDNTVNTGDPKLWNFEVLRQCRDSHAVTFKDIKRAIAAAAKGHIHTLCKLVKGDFIGYDREPEKWDVIPTEEHIDRLVPLVGNKSLPFLIELGMDFHTWERISHKQHERDLVRLNKDILEEWSNKFCRMHSLKPTLRTIAQSFSNIGKNVKIVENALLDLF
ncbi:Hypothetical predicted protein [Mytilus galloprovincialis]|uniref:C-terminal of Roc (COR) domain-containing protein n=1 Tax=Mytilus galloprovincialis TaxID=29158 RepID=A0A8B6DT56_MYTGA|nr:Hypothetical predicted protein [Mytilus galloprovincialis]